MSSLNNQKGKQPRKIVTYKRGVSTHLGQKKELKAMHGLDSRNPFYQFSYSEKLR